MSSDDHENKFKLIKSPENLQPRNYWNTVGSKEEYFPTAPRSNSVPVLNKQGRVITDPEDEWWINSKEHHFCFWTFIRDRSQPDGTMEPLLQSEISELFGCSSTKVHFLLKEAMDRLTSPENMQILQNLFELTEEEPSDEKVGHGSFVEFDRLEEEDSD